MKKLLNFDSYIKEGIMQYLTPTSSKYEQDKYSAVIYFKFIDSAIKNLRDFGYDASRDNIFTEPIYYTHLYHRLLDTKLNGNKFRDNVIVALRDSLKRKIDNENK